MTRKRISLGLIAVFVLLASAAVSSYQVALAQPLETSIPPGFALHAATYGVKIYHRSSGGVEEYVQIIDLRTGARAALQHGEIQGEHWQPGAYGGPDPLFARESLATAWEKSSEVLPDILCVSNGAFFSPDETPSTPLAFPLKKSGKVVTEGYGRYEFPGEKLMLELWPDHAQVSTLSKEALYASNAPDIIAGVSKDGSIQPLSSVPRTFVGTADRNGDGRYETLFIYNTTAATQAEAASTLYSFGAAQVMMLDGGGSTQLICEGQTLVRSRDARTIPQTLATVPGSAKTVALLVDSSGSMDWNDPEDKRIEAARVFIDAARIGDQIAIVDFDGSAVTLAGLQRIQADTDRATLKAKLLAIDSEGSTDLNEALNAGFDQLLSDAGDNSRAAVLITDGKQDGSVPNYDDLSHMQYQARGWPIYTVGLGSGVDTELLQRMADVTGGAHVHLDNPEQMQTVYAEISAEIGGDEILLDDSVWLATGEQATRSMSVPPSQIQTTFYSGWPGSTATLDLTTPSGTTIDANTSLPGVRHVKGLTYDMYVVEDPEPGQWQLHIYGDDLDAGGERVELRVFSDGRPVRRVYLPLLMLNHTTAVPSTPVLLAPHNGVTLSNLVPLYRWDNGTGGGATSLRLQVATDADFTDVVGTLWSNQTSGIDEFRFPRNLESATTHYWRAWFVIDDVPGAASETWSFRTGAGGTMLSSPMLLAPANGSSMPGTAVTLRWSPVEGATEYLVWWHELGAGSYYYRWLDATEVSIGLRPSTTYEWWVSAVNDYAVGAESTEWQLTTASATVMQGEANQPEADRWIEQSETTCIVRKASSR